MKVWRRFHFPSLAALRAHSARYVRARCQRLAARLASAPPRRPWPATWGPPEHLPSGRVIFIRRTSEHGQVALLGHSWRIDRHWCHRLVRAEVDLAHGEIRCFALRRSAPDQQPLLTVLPYRYPRDDLER